MSTLGPTPNDAIARLVRATLDADARGVDADRLQSQILERLAEQRDSFAPPPGASKTLATVVKRRAFRASLAAATLLLITGLVGYLFVSTAPVQAFALVQSAQLVLQRSADREYRVNFDEANQLPFLNSVDEVRLWTRGDRYRVLFSRGDKSLLWGRDENRRLWVISSPNKALSFEPEEIPPELAAFLSYLSLDIRRLTDQILQNCDLTYSEDMHEPQKGMKTVRATAKKGRGQVEFSTAELEINEATKVIRQLQLTRRVNGVDQGRCLFTLVDDRPQADESYRLSGYLEEGGQVLGKSKYYDRMIDLFRVIGEFTKK